MVKGSMVAVLLALILAYGVPGARGAVNIPDNCDTADAAVWTGWIHGERRDTLSDPTGSVTHAYTTSVHIRLREIKQPIMVHIVKTDRSAKYGIRYVGCHIRLKVEASEIRTGYDGTCSNHTTSTYADADNESGTIGYKTSNEQVHDLSDEDIPSDGIYMLVFAPPGMWSPCTNRFPEVAYMLGNKPLGIGDTRYYGYKLTDQQIADNIGDPKLRLLSEKRTRMTGSYSYNIHQNTTSIKVLWDICREGNKHCAAGPDASPPTAPPPITAQAPPRLIGCSDGTVGFLYFWSESGEVHIFAAPTTGSPMIWRPPEGGRSVFRQTVVEKGVITWYYVEPLGGQTGWIRAQDVSCQRPYQIMHVDDRLHRSSEEHHQQGASGAAASTVAERG